MKRFFIIAAASMLAIASLTSCGEKNSAKGKEFGYALITAEYHINDAMNKIADVTMNIKKMDGAKLVMPVSTTSQVVDIDKYSKTLPAVFTYAFSAKPTGTATESDSYTTELVYKFTVKVYDSNGKLVKSDNASETVKNTVKGNGLEDYINYFNKAYSGEIEVGADMSISVR